MLFDITVGFLHVENVHVISMSSELIIAKHCKIALCGNLLTKLNTDGHFDNQLPICPLLMAASECRKASQIARLH